MKFSCCAFVASAVLALGSLVLYSGCSVDSADSFYRDVSINYSGFYQGSDGKHLVDKNSGSAINTLNLRQDGNNLQAVDNNGIIWKGKLGDPDNGNSSFQLKGTTTAGQEGTFAGVLSSSSGSNSSGSAQGTMSGTYVEPSFYSTFYGTAQSIPGSTDNGGATNGTITITANPTSVAVNGTSTLTASGGVGTYTWSESGVGSISPTTGTTVTYSRGSSTNATTIEITVKDNSGNTGSVTLTLN